MGRSDRPREFRDDDGRGLEGGLGSIVSETCTRLTLTGGCEEWWGGVAKVRE